MILMIYRVTTVSGMREEYLREFGKICNEVRMQKGCIEYDIYVDVMDPSFDNQRREDVAVVVEKWETLESLKEHTLSAIMNEFRQTVRDLKLISEYELLTLPKMIIPQLGCSKCE